MKSSTIQEIKQNKGLVLYLVILLILLVAIIYNIGKAVIVRIGASVNTQVITEAQSATESLVNVSGFRTRVEPSHIFVRGAVFTLPEDHKRCVSVNNSGIYCWDIEE